MKENAMNTFIHLLLPILLEAIVVIVVIAALKGNAIPLIHTPRASLVALLGIGMTMCTLGGVGQIGTNGRWDSPLAIIGSLLGVIILVIVIAALTGWNLPFISSTILAVKAVGFLITLKLILGIASFFFHWL